MSDRPSVGADDYRAVMRHWPSGVTVITMPEGEAAHGMTASAFTSVSVSPPMVLVVVDKRWRSHGYIRAAGVFCVNILAADQRHVSDRFAGRHGDMDDRFFDLATGEAVTGAPFLEDAIAYLDCEVDAAHDAGDHTIFVGRVVAAGVHRPEADPLLYHDTRYATLEVHPDE